MLKLNDLIHLPQVEPLLAELVAGGPGLVVIAGLDPRPVALPASVRGLLPSGRSTIWRILMRQILEARRGTRAILVSQGGSSLRLPREFQRRVEIRPVVPPESYADALARAAARRPDLLVVEHLDGESAAVALEAAQSGLRVLSQIDTVFRGAEVTRQLLELGVPRNLLAGIAWIVAVQRLPTLCPHCREPVLPEAEQLAAWSRRYPQLESLLRQGAYFRAAGCRHCRNTGREGEVTAFDFLHNDPAVRDPLDQPSRLPLEAYMLGLAAQGYLPVQDVVHFEASRLRRTYRLLAASEQALNEARSAQERRLAELEAANRVLQQRTEALVSLESIGQALITSASLSELAGRLCRSACQLCGADRAIFYFLQPEGSMAEVLAVRGWDPALVGRPLDAPQVFGPDIGSEPLPFQGWPPGVERAPTDVTADALRAALRVPLVAQDRPVGLMIVHTSQKSRFAPGEVALLRAFGNQAALAIQRAGLTEALREKVIQLEAAQAELVQKERMERELELARQVQQSVLPRVFPLLPGYAFAGRSEPARQVGGDFYDVILLDAERVGLVIGDVSDKGMPAALYMAQVQSLLRAETRRGLESPDLASPRRVLSNVHRLLQELGRSNMFITVFYGVLDVPKRRLTYVRAGHDRPFLLRGGQVHTLGGQGTVLGFPDLDELFLSEEQLDLERGDRLVLYTDGLTDVLGPDGRTFGRERLMALLSSRAGLGADELCAATFAELAAYQEADAQYDDMTLLILEVQ